MANDNAPFEVGQKVVSLIDSSMIAKGDIFTVLGLRQGCHTWFIDIGLISPIDISLACKICASLLILEKGKEFWPEAKCFAPYNPYSNSVSKELAEKAMKPAIEVDQPLKELETINN